MSYAHTLTLLSNVGATGSPVAWAGGKAMFMAEGTFGGATVSIAIVTPNGTTVPVASLTAIGAVMVELPPGNVVATVASGSPSALYAYLVKVPQ